MYSGPSLQYFSFYIQAREAGMTLEFKQSLPMQSKLCLFADPRKIAQVLGNLLSNALKFAGPNGNIKVSLSIQSAATSDDCEHNCPPSLNNLPALSRSLGYLNTHQHTKHVIKNTTKARNYEMLAHPFMRLSNQRISPESLETLDSKIDIERGFEASEDPSTSGSHMLLITVTDSGLGISPVCKFISSFWYE